MKLQRLAHPLTPSSSHPLINWTNITMQYCLLGHTGVHVSALCYGTMSFGGDADEADVAAPCTAAAATPGSTSSTAPTPTGAGAPRRSWAAHGRPPRRAGHHHQGRLSHARREQRRRALAPPHRARGGGQPAPARHRPDRRLLRPPLRPPHAHRGDAGGASTTWCSRARSSIRRSATGRPGRSPRRWASARGKAGRSLRSCSPCTT